VTQLRPLPDYRKWGFRAIVYQALVPRLWARLQNRMNYNRHSRRSAARKTTSAVNASHQTRYSRVLVVLLAFVALIIQTLVVQTHIHIPQGAGKVQSVSLITVLASTVDTGNDHSSGAPRDKYPVNEDPWNCPLCQEFGHSGQFVASTAVLVSLPYSIAVSFIVFKEIIPTLFAVSHTWQGRAPPQP